MNKIKDEVKEINKIEEKTSKRGRNVYENIDDRFMQAGIDENKVVNSQKDTLYALLDENQDDDENYKLQGNLC